jgi:hypothetical protein
MTSQVASTMSLQPRYAFASALTRGESTTMALAVDGGRSQAPHFSGNAQDPALVRDLVATMLAVQRSDFRYQGRDRAAYLSYLLASGKKANKEIWDAQRTFLEAQFRPQSSLRDLDPICSVDDEGLCLEVFSKDESSYAQLRLHKDAFTDVRAQAGTALMSWPSGTSAEDIDAVGGRVPLRLQVGGEGAKTPVHTAYDVATSFVRGFLQVQSAAALASQAGAVLAPIDLYNVMLQLRMRKAKTPPRGLRLELLPGQAPRIAIEPWDIVLESHGPVYAGATPVVARMYGRQRILLLQRLLPHATRCEIRTLGPGMPSFFVLDCGAATLTLAVTGWSESSWAGSAAADRLLPTDVPAALVKQVADKLQKRPHTLAELGDSKTPAATLAACQTLCARGQVRVDVAQGKLAWRPLLDKPIDDDLVRYSSERDEHAQQLVKAGAVKVTKTHQDGATLEVVGDAEDRGAGRTYGPRFTIDVEGRVTGAACSCPHHRRSGTREGPCAHLLALRLQFARDRAVQDSLRDTPEGRAQIRAETRRMMRRDEAGKPVFYRITLDGNVVRVVREGEEFARHQRVGFDNEAQARDAYFQRLDALTKQGFVDGEDALGL